jgi:hypothetical protein
MMRSHHRAPIAKQQQLIAPYEILKQGRIHVHFVCKASLLEK